MRHLKKKNKLGVRYGYKKSIISNLSNSLIKYEFLKTTNNKAKKLRFFLEPIINISKYFYNSNIRFVFNKLRNVDSVLKLFKIIGPRYIDRNGGYLSILKNNFRKGDNALLSIIRLL